MTKLAQIAEEYVYLKGINPKPVKVAVDSLILICGDKPLEDYDRQDARRFVDSYSGGKVKTTTIRRRLNSINALFNWAAYELDLDRRNPFTRLIIRGEGKDAETREPFSVDELKTLYPQSISYGKIRLTRLWHPQPARQPLAASPDQAPDDPHHLRPHRPSE